ncbi:MAG TPA: DNA-binding domain-containing protein, partial [Ottowia sp.]|nr:DNA-binding domain-containing protein [Ottowia sp.]
MNASATSQDNTLAAFQRDFVQALFGADGLGAATHPGFAVYRNTVRGGCIDALEANYPVVTALVGRDWFRASAAEYAHQCPPTDVRLMMYGEDFGNFLAGLDSAAELPYLPAVA